MPILLVRHAVALGRKAWSQPDHLRPLSLKGRAQAAALVDLLLPFGVDRILSSPAVRCVETIAPLADRLGVPIDVVQELGEGSGAAAAALVDASVPGTTLLCTHGDVVPELFGALVAEAPLDEAAFRCAKGSTWLIAANGQEPKYLPPPAVT